jgi:hypothetical protein
VVKWMQFFESIMLESQEGFASPAVVWIEEHKQVGLWLCIVEYFVHYIT